MELVQSEAGARRSRTGLGQSANVCAGAGATVILVCDTLALAAYPVGSKTGHRWLTCEYSCRDRGWAGRMAGS